MRDPVDVIIVGAGTAGLSALREVKKRTERFLLINDGPWGTMCARVGCMPSKALISAANAFHARHRLKELGIGGGDALRVDVPAVLRRVRDLRDTLVAGNLDVTDAIGERAIAGRAQLLSSGSVRVNGQELRARRIIIATGSTPVVPKPWLALRDRLLTTEVVAGFENVATDLGPTTRRTSAAAWWLSPRQTSTCAAVRSLRTQA